MRILYLNPSGQLGGAETSLLTLLGGLRRLQPDWDLRLIAAADGPLLGRARDLGVRATVLPFPAEMAHLGEGSMCAAVRALPAVLKYAGALRTAVRESNASVIHTNGFKMHLLGAWMTPRDKVLCHLHDYLGARRVTGQLMRAVMGRFAAIVANSASVASELPKSMERKTSVVHNGVDTARFGLMGSSLDLDSLCGFPPAGPDVIRCGLLATFAHWKGHGTFLRAIASIPAEIPIRAYVIGGPIYQTGGSQYSLAELRAEAARLGLERRVGFTGFVEDSAAVIRALDIIVHASTKPEPFGMVIIEGMACGKPVIASLAGGAAEIVENGVTALGHEPGNAASLAEQIIRLTTERALRRRLGIAARAAVEARFSAGKMAEGFAAVYRQLSGTAVTENAVAETCAA